MPQFRIATNSGNGLEPFDEPLEFPDQGAAALDAQVALTDMCRENLPHAGKADYRVQIEDETGKPVYKASLKFEAETDDMADSGTAASIMRPAR